MFKVAEAGVFENKATELVEVKRAPAPIQVEAHGQMASLLRDLGVGLAIASYQASSVVVASCDAAGLSVLPRTFDKPMSLSSANGRLAIATRNELVVLAASTALGPSYPRTPGVYSQMWLPRSVRYTGEIDLHDIAFSGGSVIGAATRFSCLARMDDAASFTPLWRPEFISELLPDDRCHMNGMALDTDGTVRYVTALGASDAPEGWRADRATGGVLMSVPDGRIVVSGLSMPHSPRLIDGVLYVLNSGAGEVLKVDPVDGRTEVLARLPGYTRGLALMGDLLFVGLSKLRDRKGAGAAQLPVEAGNASLSSGVMVLDRCSGRVLGGLTFTAGIEEISDLALLAGGGRHGILNHSDPGHRAGLALPDQGFWAQPESVSVKHGNSFFSSDNAS